MLHFLGSHRREVAAPFIGLEQHFVGNDVEFFLRFALHVVAAGVAVDAGQRTLADGVADRFAGAGDDFDEQSQFCGNNAFFALLFD